MHSRSKVRALKFGAPALAALAVVATLAGPASAEVPSGATFLNDEPINLTVASGQPLTLALSAVNGSDGPERLKLFLFDLRMPEKTTFVVPGRTSTGFIGKTNGRIAPGHRLTVPLEIDVGGDAGLVTGQFVVKSSDGSVDRRSMTITVTPAPTPSPVETEQPSFSSTTSTRLSEPFPSIALSIEVPSIGGMPSPAPQATFQVEPEVAPSLVPAALINARGDLATVAVNADGVIVLEAREPGAYKGKLLRNPQGDEEKGPQGLADLTLNVRHDIRLALVLLLIGLFIGFLIEWFLTDRLPRTSLRARLADLRERADTAADLHRAWIAQNSDWPNPDDREPPMITTRVPDAVEEPPSRFEALADTIGGWLFGLLTLNPVQRIGAWLFNRPAPKPLAGQPYLIAASRQAENDFDAMAAVDVRAERWSVKGSEFKKLVDAVDVYEKLLLSRQTLAESWIDFLQLLQAAEVKWEIDLRRYLPDGNVQRGILDALVDGTIALPDDITARKTTVDALLKTVQSMNELAFALTTIGRWAKSNDTKDQLRKLWQKLASIITSATEIEALQKESRTLYDKVLAEQEAPAPEDESRVVLNAFPGLSYADLHTMLEARQFTQLFRAADVVYVDTALSTPTEAGALRDLPIGRPAVDVDKPVELSAIVESPEEARSAQLRSNVAFALLVGSLAIITGLSSNYIGKDTFGSPSDYLAIFTWGTVGTAAGQFLKSIPAITALMPRK